MREGKPSGFITRAGVRGILTDDKHDGLDGLDVLGGSCEAIAGLPTARADAAKVAIAMSGVVACVLSVLALAT